MGGSAQVRRDKVLRAMVGPGADKVMSAKRLAELVGVHPSYIGHLSSGRATSCSQALAHRIAEALGVDVSVIFIFNDSTDRHQPTNDRVTI